MHNINEVFTAKTTFSISQTAVCLLRLNCMRAQYIYLHIKKLWLSKNQHCDDLVIYLFT